MPYLVAVLALPLGGAAAQASLSVTPAYTYLTAQAPYGSFRLRNEGTQPLEIIVTAEYGVIESDSAGRGTAIVTGHAGLLGDLTDRLTFFPERLILAPAEERVVRYLVEGAEALPAGGHIALIHYRMRERAMLSKDAIPAIATAISIEYSLVAPLVVVSGPGASRLGARLLETSGSTLALLLISEGRFPFAGGVRVEQEGQVLGRAVTALYTRRRVDIELSAPLLRGPWRLVFDNDYPGLSEAVRRDLQVPAPLELHHW